jgi:hypothetical protein
MEDWQLFRLLILGIHDRHKDAIERSKVGRDYEELSRTYHPLTSNRGLLERLLPKDDELEGSFKNYYLYLKPVEHGVTMIPVLNLIYDFGCSLPRVRIYLGLFQRHEDYIKGIGYRFEAPEGISTSGSGRHHFYHLQMIRGFPFGGFFYPPEFMAWLPDSEPTIPLDAQNPIHLLCCLLISLYGLEEFKTFLAFLTASDRYVGKETEGRIGELRYNLFQEERLRWYWKIVPQQNPSKILCAYDTHILPDDFRNYVSRAYPKHSPIGITSKSFNLIPKGRRKRTPG